MFLVIAFEFVSSGLLLVDLPFVQDGFGFF